MKIIADNTKINNLINTLESNNNDLKNELDDLLNQISLLKEVWQGEDADKFYTKATSYINFLKVIPNIKMDINNVMKSANKNYKLIDSSYAETLKKAVVRHE